MKTFKKNRHKNYKDTFDIKMTDHFPYLFMNDEFIFCLKKKKSNQ